MANPTPKKLSEALGVSVFRVIKELMDRNCFATLHTGLHLSDAAAICRNHGVVFQEAAQP